MTDSRPPVPSQGKVAGVKLNTKGPRSIERLATHLGHNGAMYENRIHGRL